MTLITEFINFPQMERCLKIKEFIQPQASFWSLLTTTLHSLIPSQEIIYFRIKRILSDARSHWREKSPVSGSSTLPCLSKLSLLTLSEKHNVQELFKPDLQQICALVTPTATMFFLWTGIHVHAINLKKSLWGKISRKSCKFGYQSHLKAECWSSLFLLGAPKQGFHFPSIMHDILVLWRPSGREHVSLQPFSLFIMF